MQKQHFQADLPRIGYAREPQILRVIPWGRSTLWNKAKTGEFPKPVKLSARITAWRCEDVWRWLDAQESKAA
jgi:prophage regulatory protein